MRLTLLFLPTPRRLLNRFDISEVNILRCCLSYLLASSPHGEPPVVEACARQAFPGFVNACYGSKKKKFSLARRNEDFLFLFSRETSTHIFPALRFPSYALIWSDASYCPCPAGGFFMAFPSQCFPPPKFGYVRLSDFYICKKRLLFAVLLQPPRPASPFELLQSPSSPPKKTEDSGFTRARTFFLLARPKTFPVKPSVCNFISEGSHRLVTLSMELCPRLFGSVPSKVARRVEKLHVPTLPVGRSFYGPSRSSPPPKALLDLIEDSSNWVPPSKPP